MEHDLETLEHQTAPESTRGLFDPPEQNVSLSLYLSSFYNLPRKRICYSRGVQRKKKRRKRKE